MNKTDTPPIRVTQSGDLPLLHIHNHHATAVIALQGAQLLSYQRHGAQPLIWLSEEAAYRKGQSVRGGIPVCWPWFGDLARNPPAIQQRFAQDGAPAHGLVRNENWLIDAIAETDAATRITLRHPKTGGALAGIDLQLEISVGETLQLALRTTNNSNSDYVFSQALHSYFAVSDIADVEVAGLEHGRYIETLENWIEKPQTGAITCQGETDRIYLDTPPEIVIRDAGWQRRIHIQSTASHSAVVWNPWTEKAKRLSQFADDAWQRMLCVETANVLDDCVRLAPGAQHTLDVTIRETVMP